MAHAAIVTLAIGSQYQSYWQTYCQAGWQAYATKHGYDLIVLHTLLDHSPLGLSRSPAWQKCLILSQDFSKDYSQIIWLDSDIVINPHTAPCITEQVPVDRVGGVLSGGHIHEDHRAVLLERLRGEPVKYERGLQRWREDQSRFYTPYGLRGLDAGIIQTGVLVASPQHHREIFEAVYNASYPVETRSYEQIPLSHSILSRELFCPIDARFNYVFFESAAVHYPYLMDKNLPGHEVLAKYAARTQYANNFFLHFAYEQELVRFLVD